MPKHEYSSARLYFEGTDDEHVVRAVVRKLAPDLELPRKGVCGPEGDRDFGRAVRNAVDAFTNDGIARVGVVLDRDGRRDDAGDPLGAKDRWAEVTNALSAAGLVCPEAPAAGGIRLLRESQRLGIWLMPENVTVGALEQFLVPMIPTAKATLWEHARKATEAAQTDHLASIPRKYVVKAELRAFVAWQPDPGQPFGRALTIGSFDPTLGAGATFMDWFRWVFVDA